MAKLSKEDFNKKYSEMITDNDELLISLMEDFADSISPDESSELETVKKELEDAKAKVTELTQKYKERFLDAVADTEEKEEVTEDLEEKEIIDVKEI